MHSIVTSTALLLALATPARAPAALNSAQISTRVRVCTDGTSQKDIAPHARDVVVQWEPAVPHAGSLFRVHITSGWGAIGLTGALAREPLHFRASGSDATAWGAVPIDSTNGVTLEVRCSTGPNAHIRIPTAAGDYPLEQLRVAPKFSTQPDSALAVRLREEAEHASAVSRGAHETPRMWSAPFMAPRASRITSGFGGGRMFNGTVASRHMGTDYAAGVGDPVRAANRGIVRLVSAFYLGGNVIYLDHGDGIVTAYLHLSRQLVQVGDTVARGAIIGRVGATGRVTGPHLHLIARFGTITIDAASLIAMRDSL